MDQLIVLTRNQYITDVEQAAQRGAEIALKAIADKTELDGKALVKISEVASIYGYTPETLIKRAKSRLIELHGERNIKVERRYINELLKRA